MADRKEGTRKEASPSREREEIPVMHEVGESSRPPQVVPPPAMVVSQGPGTQDDAFRTQLVTAVTMFTQLMQNPRFQKFLQPVMVPQPVGQPAQTPVRVEVQRKGKHAADSVETPWQLAESVETPR